MGMSKGGGQPIAPQAEAVRVEEVEAGSSGMNAEWPCMCAPNEGARGGGAPGAKMCAGGYEFVGAEKGQYDGEAEYNFVGDGRGDHERRTTYRLRSNVMIAFGIMVGILLLWSAWGHLAGGAGGDPALAAAPVPAAATSVPMSMPVSAPAVPGTIAGAGVGGAGLVGAAAAAAAATAGAQASPPSTGQLQQGCDAVCLLKGQQASCRNRITWLKDKEFKDHGIDACRLSVDKVLGECPVCGGCAEPEIAGCSAAAASGQAAAAPGPQGGRPSRGVGFVVLGAGLIILGFSLSRLCVKPEAQDYKQSGNSDKLVPVAHTTRPTWTSC